MGRPTILKKAMTAAQRQKRRRRKVRREKREVEAAATRGPALPARLVWTPHPGYPDETRDEHHARMAGKRRRDQQRQGVTTVAVGISENDRRTLNESSIVAAMINRHCAGGLRLGGENRSDSSWTSTRREPDRSSVVPSVRTET